MQTRTGLYYTKSLNTWAIQEGKTKPSYTGPKLVRFDVSRLKGREKKFHQLEEKYKATRIQLERTKLELRVARQHNRTMEADIQKTKTHNEDVTSQISDVKVKVGLAQDMANNSKGDMDELRDRFHKDEIEIARLEERLKGFMAEIDRLKNQENPDSIVGIRKILINDKKEIRKVKDSIGECKKENIVMIRDLLKKTQKVEKMEEHLESLHHDVRKCEKDRVKALHLAEENKRMKQDFKAKSNELSSLRDKFGLRLKSTRARLGMTVSLRNVNMKMLDEFRQTDQDLHRQILNLEKRLREAVNKRDKLKVENIVTKTQESVTVHKDRFRKRNMMQNTQNNRSLPHGTGFQRGVRLSKILVISRDGEAIPLSAEDTSKLFHRRLPQIPGTPRPGQSSRPKMLPSTAGVTPHSDIRTSVTSQYSRPWTLGATPKPAAGFGRERSRSN